MPRARDRGDRRGGRRCANPGGQGRPAQHHGGCLSGLRAIRLLCTCDAGLVAKNSGSSSSWTVSLPEWLHSLPFCWHKAEQAASRVPMKTSGQCDLSHGDNAHVPALDGSELRGSTCQPGMRGFDTAGQHNMTSAPYAGLDAGRQRAARVHARPVWARGAHAGAGLCPLHAACCCGRHRVVLASALECLCRMPSLHVHYFAYTPSHVLQGMDPCCPPQ